MTKYLAVLTSVSAALLASQAALGQGMRGLPTEGPGGYIRPHVRFEMAPEIGDRLPDIMVVDRKGNPMNLRDITGDHYTVLVAGCLT